MKVIDVILLPFAAAMVIIGAHMTWTQGVLASYPVFMLAVASLFWFKYRKTSRKEVEEGRSKAETIKKKKKKRQL